MNWGRIQSMGTRAVIYTRVSQDQAQGRSPAEQEAESRAVCAREGWDVALVVTDTAGASRHSKGSRSGWANVTKLIEAGEVDVLVTWEASRAHRDLKAYTELRDLCTGNDVLWSYSGKTNDLTKGDDRFTTGLDALLSEREAEQTSERVRRAVRANAVKGRPHGRRLFGYRRVYDEATGTLVGQEPEPIEAGVVRRIHAEFLGGSGIASIATGLGKDEIKTGTGAKWDYTQVKRALKNAAYTGLRVHRGEIVGDATWEPLVSRTDFDRAQARLEEMAKGSKRYSKTARMLTGVARCGVCRAPIRCGHDRNKRKVYQCKEKFCVARDMRKLDDFVSELMVERLRRPDVAAALTTQHEFTEPDPVAGEVAILRARLDDAIGEFNAGRLTGATLARIEADILPKIEDAEKHMRRAMVPIDIDLPSEDKIEQWWIDLQPEVRREVASTMIATVTIKKTKQGSRTFDHEAIKIEWRR